jgi:hypothetical protein
MRTTSQASTIITAARQCLLTAFAQIDYRVRIIFADDQPGGLLILYRHLPGVVDIFFCYLFQLRQIAAYIFALRIILPALTNRIENAEIRCRIGTAAGGPLPAQTVVGEIGVDQGIPEPARAFLPGNAAVFAQKRRHHHPHPVMHPAGLPQLAHPGVDQRDTGPALLPGLQ